MTRVAVATTSAIAASAAREVADAGGNAVDCALESDRVPQSGPLMAWDTMAVLMAAYESSEKDGAFVDISEFVAGREFTLDELPDPRQFGAVFQRIPS